MAKKMKNKEVPRFDMYQFDHQTWVVFDKIDEREICVCSDYDDWKDGVERAKKIVLLLNQNTDKTNY